MLKIKKGLKKKGKGKKDKGEDLFDPEQLAKYKKELEENKREASTSATAHALSDEPGHEESGTREEDDEWKRFKLLTAGIDSTLKKTSGDLDRIKTSSYFQRKEPEAHVEHVVRDKDHWEGFDKAADASEFPEHSGNAEAGSGAAGQQWDPVHEEPAIPEHVESPEEEIVLEDELFDTTFVDAIASGQIKLAYIPDSPTEEPDGDDPFDTSGVADVIKKITEEEKKEKRRVNLGGAVGFLTGQAKEEEERQKQLKSSAVASHRRRRPVNVNLIGDFDDENFEGIPCDTAAVQQTDFICTGDSLDVQIDSEFLTPSHELSVTLAPDSKKNSDPNQIDVKELLREFETFGESECTTSANSREPVHDEEYFIVDEFAELASQSLSRSGVTPTPAAKEDEPDENAEPDPFDTSYATEVLPADNPSDCLGDKVLVASTATSRPEPAQSQNVIEDPFDTSALNQLQPGSAELKLLEQELAQVEGKIPVRPPPPVIKAILKQPSEDDFDFDPRKDEAPKSPVKELHPLDSVDAFGADDTLSPQKEVIETEPDPFDTSSVPTSFVPGKTELRLLETELADLADSAIVGSAPLPIQLSDFDFDPRGIVTSDPFVVEADPFVVEADPFVVNADPFVVDPSITQIVPGEFQDDFHSSDIPLNPSPALPIPTQPATAAAPEVVHEDPFDTSTVNLNELYLGKKELQVLESELLNTHVDVLPPQNPLASLKAIQSAKPTPVQIQEEVELHPLDHTDTEHSRTPIQPLSPSQNGSGWNDPFDTSAADAIIPSKLQVKLLEEELGVHSSSTSTSRLYDDPDFNPRDTVSTTVHFNNCPLTPAAVQKQEVEADPFDTSAAEALVPGKTELKVLEAELL